MAKGATQADSGRGAADPVGGAKEPRCRGRRRLTAPKQTARAAMKRKADDDSADDMIYEMENTSKNRELNGGHRRA